MKNMVELLFTRYLHNNILLNTITIDFIYRSLTFENCDVFLGLTVSYSQT